MLLASFTQNRQFALKKRKTIKYMTGYFLISRKIAELFLNPRELFSKM